MISFSIFINKHTISIMHNNRPLLPTPRKSTKYNLLSKCPIKIYSHQAKVNRTTCCKMRSSSLYSKVKILAFIFKRYPFRTPLPHPYSVSFCTIPLHHNSISYNSTLNLITSENEVKQFGWASLKIPVRQYVHFFTAVEPLYYGPFTERSSAFYGQKM